MNDALSEKRKSTDVLVDRAITIQDEFISIFGTSRPDITIAIRDALAMIQKASAALDIEISRPLETRSALPLDTWNIAEHIGAIDDGFTKIAEIVSMVDIMETKSGASHTYLITTRADMDSFLGYHRMFVADSINSRIYSALVEKIRDESPEDAEAKHLKHAHSAVLYAHYLQDALSRLPVDADEHRPYLLALERAKDRAILGHEPTEQKKAASSQPHWPLQRFGLIPIRQHMSPEELVAYYFGDVTTGGGTLVHAGAKAVSIGTFISMAKMKKIGVLVMSAVTTSPVEYNISSLMEATPGLDASAGLSSAILKKFTTVKKHIEYDADGRAVPPTSPGFSMIRHIASAASRQYAVVRTIDGSTYDAMQNSESKYVDISTVEKILRGPSPRVDAYQKIKAADFGRFIMPAPPMGETVKKANKLLIQDLVNRITGRIIQYVDTSLLPLPENPRGLEDAISNPRFAEILMDEFLKSYAASGVNPKTPVDELAGTFIADLENNIAIQFARNIKLNMIELGPSANVFRDYQGDTLRTRLYNIFVDVIKRSVSSSILTKENIYEKILIKDHLLGMLAAQLSKAGQKS